MSGKSKNWSAAMDMQSAAQKAERQLNPGRDVIDR